jgi:lysophospholipase L1-like esterase
MHWINRHWLALALVSGAALLWLGVFLWQLDRALHPKTDWTESMQAYSQMDATNPPPSRAVLFVGSSSIRLWESIRRDFPNYRVFRRGLNGARLEDTLRMADGLILTYNPKMVVIYGGDNDLAEGDSPARVLHAYQRLVRRIQRELGDVRIGILSIKPSPSRWHLIRRVRETNQRLRDWCEASSQIDFIDIHSGMLNERGQPRARLYRADGLHLSDLGYARWAECIRPYLPASARKTNAGVLASVP